MNSVEVLPGCEMTLVLLPLPHPRLIYGIAAALSFRMFIPRLEQLDEEGIKHTILDSMTAAFARRHKDNLPLSDAASVIQLMHVI